MYRVRYFRSVIRLCNVCNTLMHAKGCAGARNPSGCRARSSADRTKPKRSGEPLEDPLLLFSVLYSYRVARFVAFNGKVMRELAAHFLTLAGKNKERRSR